VKKKVILLVEDNPNDVFLTERALKKTRIESELVVARDGVEALDYLFCRQNFDCRNASCNPQLVLLDLKLPKIDGFEVLKQIRQDARTRLLPVVVLTSSTEEKDILNSYAFGANSYVCKPVDYNQFVDLLRNLGQFWLVLNRSPFSDSGD